MKVARAIFAAPQIVIVSDRRTGSRTI